MAMWTPQVEGDSAFAIARSDPDPSLGARKPEHFEKLILSAWGNVKKLDNDHADRFEGIAGSHTTHKLPDFKVPRFSDETIEGQDFVKSIERAFKSHALTRYLTDT